MRLAVADLLTDLGVPAADVAREQREMAWHRFDRTRSRQVLGSMNDFAFLADVYIREQGPDADLAAIARMLNRAPCTPIQHRSPERFAPTLFHGASEAPRSHGPPPATLAIHRTDHVAVKDRAIYRIKVALRDIRPPIWRRIEVESDISLLAFHRILQAAMGWTDSHLHQFIQNGTYYGTPDPEFDIANNQRTSNSPRRSAEAPEGSCEHAGMTRRPLRSRTLRSDRGELGTTADTVRLNPIARRLPRARHGARVARS